MREGGRFPKVRAVDKTSRPTPQGAHHDPHPHPPPCALVAASSAFAETPLVDTTPFVSSKTRAEVPAELQQYRTAGVNPWAQSYDQLRGLRSSKTRAQVTAEYLQSRDQTAALTAEDSGSCRPPGHARPRFAADPVLAGQPVNAQ